MTENSKNDNNGKNLKIVFTGGGTGGHVYPNVALFDDFEKAGFDVAYIGGTGNTVEKRLAHENGVKYYGVQTIKLVRSMSLPAMKNNLSIPFTLSKAVKECVNVLKKEKPNVVFSKGGFVSLPTVLAARKLDIPVVAHESDLTMGLANKIAKSKGATILKANPHSTFDGILVGLPLRKDLFTANKEQSIKTLGIKNPSGKKILLVLGGSSGAKAINDAIKDNLSALLERYVVLHVTGKGKAAERGLKTSDDKNQNSANYKNTFQRQIEGGYYVFEYADKIQNFYAASDLVLSRAGATAVFEISALKKRALFVPLPKGVSRGDQIDNACLAKEYGATILEQDENFSSSLCLALKNAEKNPPMKEISVDANGKIVNVVRGIVGACKNKKL